MGNHQKFTKLTILSLRTPKELLKQTMELTIPQIAIQRNALHLQRPPIKIPPKIRPPKNVNLLPLKKRLPIPNLMANPTPTNLKHNPNRIANKPPRHHPLTYLLIPILL
jgi:hypothetical protein